MTPFSKFLRMNPIIVFGIIDLENQHCTRAVKLQQTLDLAIAYFGDVATEHLDGEKYGWWRDDTTKLVPA